MTDPASGTTGTTMPAGTTATPDLHTAGTITSDGRDTINREARAAAARDALVADLQQILNQLDSPAQGLTSEELIDSAANNVAGVDTQIQAVMARMRNRTAQGEILRGVTESFQRAVETGGEHGTYQLRVARVSANGVEMSAYDALVAAGISRTDLDGFGAAISTGHPDAFKTLLQNAASHVTEGSEVDTLRLQSLVSQRNQVLQMASQLIAAMTETDKGILGHIGR